MDHYIDIRLKPDAEVSAAHLMDAVFAKLHRTLVELQSTQVGVSFPNASAQPRSMGQLMRLHGSAADLQALMARRWLAGASGHVQVSEPLSVPAQAAHWAVRRVQATSSPERVRRRQMKRHGYTAEQARERVPDDIAQRLTLPFVTLQSKSTGQRFLLFVKQSPAPGQQAGSFNTYGFSQTATLPKF